MIVGPGVILDGTIPDILGGMRIAIWEDEIWGIRNCRTLTQAPKRWRHMASIQTVTKLLKHGQHPERIVLYLLTPYETRVPHGLAAIRRDSRYLFGV